MRNCGYRTMSSERHGAVHGPAEVRALGERRADEQPAVRAAADGQAVAGRAPGSDEVVGGGVEVVEDVLLVLAAPGLVPGLALLVAAPQPGDGEEAARAPHHAAIVGDQAGVYGDGEAAVAGEDAGRVGVGLARRRGGRGTARSRCRPPTR